MKKHILSKVIPIIVFIQLLSGCSNDFFDVNTPSGSATEDQLRMNDLLGPAIFHTVMAQYWAERSFGNYTQYFTGQTGQAIGSTEISGTWSETYLRALPSLNTILEKAVASNSNHFRGISKVLTAINLGLATDSWDAIPYSEAASGSDNLRPGFDSQESIYQTIATLLQDAIVDLSSPDTSGFSPTDTDDLIYRGDISKWLKAAYTLKARYELHLSEINGTAAANAALASLANGFTSNADDFQMFFTSRDLNPWRSREVLARNTGNDHDKIGDQLVNYMNGTSYPFQSGAITIDPRLPIYSDKSGDSSDPWRGFLSGGEGLSSDGNSGNTNFADNGFYTRVDSPMVVISYAEALFMKAEAEFIKNGGTETSVGSTSVAYNAYLQGISANILKMGVDATDYLADTAIDVGVANLKLEHIMKEKYIANFLNPETFVDFRRYKFSPNVFRDLALPVDSANSSEFPNQWFVRAQYPGSEETRNPNNVASNKKSPVTPVWWDK